MTRFLKRFLARSRFLLALVVFSAIAISAAHAQTAASAPTHIKINSAGTGPDVIMIPGLSSSIAVWTKEAPKLLPHYRLHVVQVDGFAGTAAGANAGMKSGMLNAIVADLHDYIVANHLRSPAVIGHSLGGLLGLMLAEQHPQDVSKLVIIDSLPFFSRLMDKDTVEEAHDGAVQMRNGIAESSKQDWLKGSVAAGNSMATAKDDQQKVALWAANSDQKIVAEAMYEDMLTDARPGLPELKIPVLVLWPYSPDLGKVSEIEQTYTRQWSKAPNVKLVRVDNSKHFIMLDQPDVFDREVQAFLKQ